MPPSTSDEILEQRPKRFVVRIAEGSQTYILRVLITFVVLVGLLWLDGQFGPTTFLLRRFSAALLLAAVSFIVIREKIRIINAVLLAIILSFIAIAPTIPLVLLAYVLAICSISRTYHIDVAYLPNGLAQACFAYIGFRFFGELLPPIRVLNEKLYEIVKAYLRFATGTEHNLGMTALGFPAISLALIYLFWRWRVSASGARLIAMLMLLLTWFISLPILVIKSPGALDIFSRGAGLGLLGLAVAVLIDALASSKPRLAQSNKSQMLLVVSFSCATCILGGAILVGVINPFYSAKSILVHNRGGLDWDRPVFGKFGAFSGGMFGLLPVYVRANGYQFEVLDKEEITSTDLLGFQTLVLINSPKKWTSSEKMTVMAFVADGGSLLILGDHTNVFGLMDGFNTLLAESGIQFKFDSAYHARSTWRGCYSAAPDAVAAGWSLEGPGMGIGASLDLQGWSRPLLSGRYAHSDIGSESNVIGSFLGNYSYDPGEELGDVAMIASVVHGRGRIVVFGDTSPFQGSQSYSFPRTVGPILSLLSRPATIFEQNIVRFWVAMLWLVMILTLWVLCLDLFSTSIILFSLFLSMSISGCINRFTLSSPISIDSDCVLIDNTHLPAVGHYAARFNPSGPLETNLLRCGLRTVHLDSWDIAKISKAKGIAFIAPQRPFTRSEVDSLLEFEKSGGIVLLAVGHAESPPSQSLLSAHGLKLEGRPLGTVPKVIDNQGQERPRFLDAWPIVSTSGADLTVSSDIEVLYRTEDDITALFCRKGSGGLLLISDSRYFSSMNVEDVAGHWMGNLAFIYEVFRKYLAADPDSVQPLFNSPTKPE